ncbi:MAG: hypothetical protein M3Y93_11155 [Pseudomonadota bacterium]|nr:hypothetical protein [Pseudomonadota bacterium]
MCFSATASFTSSAVITAVGVATMVRTRHPREWLFAAIPLLFAFHQFAEGAVWLALTGGSTLGGLDFWGFVYMLYAQGLLPLLIPLGIWLIEPARNRRLMLLPFLALGAGLTLYQLWALLHFDTAIYVQGHSVVYKNPGTSHAAIAILYVVATCGSLFFSGYRYIIALGAVNLLGVLVVLWFKHYAFTSVWCAYASVVSVLVYFHFNRRRAAEKHQHVLQR